MTISSDRYSGGKRNAWMFPRNIRRLTPLKLASIMAIVKLVAEGRKWSGNQELQNLITERLGAARVKNTGELRDPRSGGARTYMAQLEALGMVFRREGVIYCTLAGNRALTEPMAVLGEQLLRFQYPSPYSRKSQVKLTDEIRIRPFIFLLEVMRDRRIQGLTDSEFAIPIALGRNHSSLSRCVKEIMRFRQGLKLDQILADEENLRLSPRARPDRFFQELRDIGNTFKNMLLAGDLIRAIPTEERREKYVVNSRRSSFMDRVMKTRFIPNSEMSESFQRCYGAPLGRKDTRRFNPSSCGVSKKELEETRVQSAFLDSLKDHPVLRADAKVPESFVNAMEKLGIDRDSICRAVEKILPRTVDIFSNEFIRLSCSGVAGAADFERAVVALYNNVFQIRAYWTGSMRSPRRLGACADVLLVVDSECAVVDAKATSRYRLGHKDILAMAETYAPRACELAREHGEPEVRSVGLILYVAGDFVGVIERQRMELSRKTGIPVAFCRAEDLLKDATDPAYRGPRYWKEMLRRATQMNI